jgi:hypothetical protein
MQTRLRIYVNKTKISISTHDDCLQQVCNVMLERNSKNIYTQKNADHENEFCRCCNASLIKSNIRRYMEVRFNSELAQAEAQANSRAR